MARQISAPSISTRTARLRLPVRKKATFVTVSRGIALGYRRCQGPGRWCVRAADGKGGNWEKSFAAADDYETADGEHVLDYAQALDKARSLARGTDADVGRPGTVAEALDDSPNWIRLDLAYRHGNKLTGSIPTTIAKLDRSLKEIDGSLPLRAKASWLAGREVQEQHLTVEFLRGIELRPGVGELTVQLVSDNEACNETMRRTEFTLFVWKPDLEKILPGGDAMSSATDQPRKKHKKHGRPPAMHWPELCAEIVRRCLKSGEFVPVDHTKLATELQEWHQRKFDFEPNSEDLRKGVGIVAAALRKGAKPPE
jgi:hypothetical protein